VTSRSFLTPRTGGPVAGSPCWAEVTTADPEATMAFYRAILGWEYIRLVDSTGVDYYVARIAGEPVAGIRPVREPLLDWIVYLATGDLGGLTRQSESLGGKVIEGSRAVPGVGAMALVEAPAGATFGACQLDADWGFTAWVPRALVWAEYITHHAQRSDEFFGHLFGYQGRQFGDGITDDYMVWYAGEDSVIGRVRMMPGTPATVPARWVAHFGIPLDQGFDEAVLAAHDAGARLRFRPYVSTLGRVAVMSDATGTRFALIDPSQAVDDGALRSAADDPFDD
jgi:predicted enzyme related to lactoylglutathione lyase